jgi:hypothetical protein
MLEGMRESLQSPDEGGDNEVMRSVDEIIAKAVKHYESHLKC